jgi:hypothetical protein
MSLARTKPMWRALSAIPDDAWAPALGMAGAEIAETTYSPQGWTAEPLRLIVRRVWVPAEELSHDIRSRRRRALPPDQRQLTLGEEFDGAHVYAFILTDKEGDIREIELWHRQRAQVEERVKDLKLGCGLRHLPLGTMVANRGWMTAAVIAHNLISLLSTVVRQTNLERLHGDLRRSPQLAPRHPAARVAAHNTLFLQRWLLCLPGRVLHSGRQVHLRLARGMPWATTFEDAYQRLRQLA